MSTRISKTSLVLKLSYLAKDIKELLYTGFFLCHQYAVYKGGNVDGLYIHATAAQNLFWQNTPLIY